MEVTKLFTQHGSRFVDSNTLVLTKNQTIHIQQTDKLINTIKDELNKICYEYNLIFSADVYYDLKDPVNYYEIRTYIHNANKEVIKQLKKHEGKLMFSFKFKNYETRQNTIGFLEMFTPENDDKPMLTFQFVEW